MAEALVTTVTVSGSTVYLPAGCKVKAIRWTLATTAGHVARIESPDGALLWRGVAAGANHEVESITERSWEDGFKVTTLQSGEIDVETFRAGTSVF